ncbi:hypothetical protein TNCV_1985371 [Trichonephila clavipes]|nr:hypothetical protein TNCV_1985371 [Trichonephila clavipes]
MPSIKLDTGGDLDMPIVLIGFANSFVNPTPLANADTRDNHIRGRLSQRRLERNMRYLIQHAEDRALATKPPTSELTRGRRGFSERTLDVEVNDPGLKEERRERWPSRDPPHVVHKLGAEVDDPGLRKERREQWPCRDPPPVVHKRDA